MSQLAKLKEFRGTQTKPTYQKGTEKPKEDTKKDYEPKIAKVEKQEFKPFTPALPFIPTVPTKERLSFNQPKLIESDLPKTTKVTAPITGSTFGLDNVKTYQAPIGQSKKELDIKDKVEKKEAKETAETLQKELTEKYGFKVKRANSPIEYANILLKVPVNQKEQFKKDYDAYILAAERSNPFRAGAEAGFNILPTNLEKTQGKETVEQAKDYGLGRFVGGAGQQAAFASVLSSPIEGLVGKVLPKATPLITETIKDVAIGAGTQLAEAPFDKPTAGQFVGNAALDVALNVLFGAVGKGLSKVDLSNLRSAKPKSVVDDVARELGVSEAEADKVLDDAIDFYVNQYGTASPNQFEQLQLPAPEFKSEFKSDTFASTLRNKTNDIYVNQFGVADTKPFEQLQLDAPKNIASDTSAVRFRDGVQPQYKGADFKGDMSLTERKYPTANLGDRKIKAFQFNNPEVQPFYREKAEELLLDATYAKRGSRKGTLARDEFGEVVNRYGDPRVTTPQMARILDETGSKYEDIQKALQDLIDDNGKENHALAKKIENVIDDMLVEGYVNVVGETIKPNIRYIQLRNRLDTTKIPIPELEGSKASQLNNQLRMGGLDESGQRNVFDADMQRTDFDDFLDASMPTLKTVAPVQQKPQLDRPSEFSIGKPQYPPLAKPFAKDVINPIKAKLMPEKFTEIDVKKFVDSIPELERAIDMDNLPLEELSRRLEGYKKVTNYHKSKYEELEKTIEELKKLKLTPEIKKQIDKLEYEKGRHGYQTNYIGQDIEILTKRISKLSKEKINLEPPNFRDFTIQKPTYPPLAKDFAREVPKQARPKIEPALKPVAEDIGAVPQSARLDITPTLKPKQVTEPIDTLSKIMTEIPAKAKPKLGENLERIYQETVSKNAPFEAIARKTDTDILRAYSSNLNRTTGTIDHNIAKYQSDMEGNQVGDSIQGIFKEVDETTKPQFFDYVLNKHNVERYEQGKPVFGDTVTSDVSLAKASQYEASYPQFAEQQKKVTTYFNNLMNDWAVKSGLVSEDTANMLKEMYPNYVPTYRATEIEKAMSSGDGNFVSQVLKKAKGSEKDILPLDQQMAILTDRTIRNARKNEVMTMLDDVYQANPEIASKYIYDVKKVGEKSKVDDLLDVGKELEKPVVKEGDKYKVTYYRNGEPYQMTINKTLYESLATVEKDALDKGLDVIKKYATNPFKSLITQKNPIFFVRNVMRDIPTALIYSNDSLGLVKNTPEAIKEMLTNGKLWNQYQAMGGTRSGLFNYEKGVKIDFAGNKKSLPKKILAGTGDALEMANNMTETLPRFAEYITSIKKGEPPMLALMRASEITTDFSRFGKQTKRADAVVPYLNASVQGLDKFFRQVRDKPLQTMAKGGLVVSIPALILDQVNKNNKDYNEMTTRERNNYYHIPVGDKFIRIPRSREVGVLFGTALEWISRKARGQEVTGEEIKETLKSNFTPVNGFDSNIIKPALNFIDIATGKNTDAKNFFGSNIVSQSLQRYSPGQQFTESTTSLSKALGEFLDVPPVAIDYLFDSYLGVVADIGMPLLTGNKKKALSPFENAFIADPVFKSASVDKLYSDINKFDQLAADANKKYDFESKLITPYEAYRNSLTKVSKELSDLRKQQKEAQAKNNEELVRELRKRMNDISKKATDSLPTEQELKKEFELFQRKVGK